VVGKILLANPRNFAHILSKTTVYASQSARRTGILFSEKITKYAR
jgi:hypothetical protein